MNNFHKTKKSAAVLKHAIIDQYATPFASKTGKTSLDHRVAFIDGYAGPGRYEDGREGSGAMLLRKAREMASFPRRVELHFVEKKTEFADQLREVAAEEGAGVTYTIDDGDISSHLPELLKSAEGIPLFTYLDPCGLIIPLDEVASIFDRPSGPGAPATEVLINLTAHLRRFGGMLHSDNAVEASLKRIDGVCGGEWWRQAWLEKCPTKDAPEDAKTAAEEAVVAGYAERLRSRAGGAGTWIIDVRPRADRKPLYYLIFATRYIDGLLTFGESASLGQQAWRKYLAEVAAEDTLFGADNAWEAEWKEQEKILKTQWIDTIAERLTRELAKGEPFRIIDRPADVLGDLAGVARTLHFRAAIKKVLVDGKTTTDPKGVDDLWRLTLKPA
ncbi:three-Cys-motif partner protein TcmP [Nocardia gipuzkoensis]|uniref:three-Cys-motif partner protein TcmP n=1 Tax=Nocardia gipuzkoensis TaxID=2749991 RepID=UPI00237DD990|nr:three-Cys-motif partner protein TcmP [Nocardia gipuzkoensis]MDE1674333.1 three-Cys-motif partner protein TcmP [Nocardia gipuzkoensis]